MQRIPNLLRCLLLLIAVLNPTIVRADSTNSAPIALVVRFDNGRANYEVNSMFVRSDKLLEVMCEQKQQKGGRDARIVVIVDNKNSLSTLSNVRGIIDKAGYFDVRYFSLNPEVGRMAEVSFDHPAIPYSLNPESPKKRVGAD
jgi:hypothetical protein